MEPGLTAGRQAGRLADEIQVIFEILKFIIDRNNRHFALLNKCKALL